MSYDPYFNPTIEFITNGDKNRFDDNQYFADYATINALTDKSVQVTYIALDTGNRYSWNGTNLIMGGTVYSVTSGDSSILVNNTNAQTPIITAVQSITTTSTPTFNNVISTLSATANNHLVRKQEFDTADGQNVKSVSSGNSSIVVGGSAQNPTISTSQSLTTTSNPTFNTVTLNGAITNNTDATTKLYVDTAVGTAVQSVTAGTNINTSGTAINPVINLNTTLTGLSSIATNTGTIATTATNPTDIANKSYVDTAVGAINLTPYMQKANNLSDLTNTTTARTNLDVFSKGEVNTALANIAMDSLLNTNLATIQASNVVGFDGVNYVPTEITSQLDITNSLLFNADFNSNINDSSTYGATGTATGTIGTVTRAGGNAREAQVTNSYISYGYLSHLNFTQIQPFTISFWTRHNITGTTQRNIITQAESGNGSGWSLLLENPSQNRIHFQMADNASARNIQVRWDLLPNLGDNNWHHIVFTKGNGITIDKFKLYYDGQLREDLKSMISNTLLLTDNIQVANTIPFNLFSRNLGEGTEFFIGSLDDVRIYNFELKEQQAKTLYTNTENNHVVLNVIDHTHNISDILTLQSTLDSKVASVSSANTNLISIGGTSVNPIITNEIGSMQPVILRVDTVMGDNQKFATDNNASLSSVTQVNIGRLPFNVGDAEYFHHVLDLIQNKCLPMRIRCTVNGTPTQYAEFVLHTSNGNTANAYQFFATFDGTRSTITALATASFVNINFMSVQRTLSSGSSKISNTVSANKETVTFDIVESNLTLGNMGGSVSVAQGGFDVNRAQRNLLSNANLQVHTFPASTHIPAVFSLTANESLTLNLNTVVDTATNYLVSLKGGGHPQKATHHTTSLKEICFAVKLSGNLWNSVSIDNCRIGFATEHWFGFIESNITQQASLVAPTWDLTNTSANKGFVAGFFNNLGYINYNNVGNALPPGQRIGLNTSNSTGQAGDVLIITFDVLNNNIIEYWYRAGVLQSTLFGNIPSGFFTSSNFFASNIVPLISLQRTGAGYDIQVLSERQLILEGIVFGNRVNYFY